MVEVWEWDSAAQLVLGHLQSEGLAKQIDRYLEEDQVVCNGGGYQESNLVLLEETQQGLARDKDCLACLPSISMEIPRKLEEAGLAKAQGLQWVMEGTDEHKN